MNPICEKLLERYLELPVPDKPIYYNNNYLRDRDHNRRLQRCFFVFAVYLAYCKGKQKQPFSLMITASHNPQGYNGTKTQVLDGKFVINKQQINLLFNHQDKFVEFLEKTQFFPSQNQVDFYIGRDTRPTSPILSSLIQEALAIIGMKVVNLGQKTTPQFFSMSQYIYQSNQKYSQELEENYYQEIEKHFSKSLKLLNQQGFFHSKKEICLDFSNGVGAISFKKYSFLQKYFVFSAINSTDFDHPNKECGAEWLFKYYKQKREFPDMNHYPKSDQYYFFDGDSDRIIGLTSQKANKKQTLLTGDDFSACFLKLGLTLLKQLDISLQDIKVAAVGNINSNLGIDFYIKSLGSRFKRTPVGIKYVSGQAKKQDFCPFFQDNGHGCVYFSEKLLEILKQKQNLWQASLLLSVHGLARNNTKGYALHNMLILQIYFIFFQTQCANLFEPAYLFERAFLLTQPEYFINSSDGIMQLVQPSDLVQQVQKIRKSFSMQEIVLRKSETQPKLRLTIQGKKDRCKQIQKLLLPFIEKNLIRQ